MKTKKPEVKVCVLCKQEFTTSIRNQLLCSSLCRTKHKTIKTGRMGLTNMNSATMGAISELEVAADLMMKGFAVFRAMSPACSCDIIMLKDKLVKRVEVRTAYRQVNGLLTWDQSDRDKGRQDIFALYVRSSNEVIYADTNRQIIEDITQLK